MTTTRTKLRHIARMLRTLSSSPWYRDGYILTFDNEPKDCVTIYRKGTDDMCLFGLHADDPFMGTGIPEDEALTVVGDFLQLEIARVEKLN